MKPKKSKKPVIPTFANQQDEAKWWGSVEGRAYLKRLAAAKASGQSAGGPIAPRLVHAEAVQVTVKIASEDLAKVREVAAKRKVGYLALLKTLLHEAVERLDEKSSDKNYPPTPTQS